ncbi:prolyl 3-hydroxylase sudestada1-like isoform X2 [Macrosteles quadrilineatus]|uniref:prolyl 3-hydroxylase sudestada1-like isoform X2 n=1 Tax=Macrosteles quadrilineatus TaxID=74068 RepID=UPI0023E31823|nr:prolyl 3-hydroxylase sudestada1-like isoform X2 [Macrosteles quadrilineatus]XP_054279850.1 prolyl 3-hydroxylase sudestada1-like isoform X2 [Macrosteles quadrilineatus]
MDQDFLLCHDDKSGTRAVAFILYLSDLLEEEDGGELRFFSTYPGDRDPKQDRYFKKVKPAENTLLMFNVSDFSFHEVEQVYVDKERLSINGWYHLPSPLDESLTCVKINQKSKVLQLEMAIKPILKQEKIISRMLLSDMFLDSVAAAFQESDEAGIIIPNVLDTEFYRTCVNEFESIEDMYWNDVGPANYRNYSTTEFEIEGPHLFFGESLFYIGNIVDYLLSNDFLNILTRITGATYAVFGPYVPPSAMVEVQRWKQGNYTLLCDNDIERDQTSIEVTVVFHLKKDLINSYEENGLVTRTRKYPKLTDSEKNSKIRTKIQRMLADHEWKSNRYPPRKRVKFEKLTKKLAAIASEKLRKINEHRSKMQDIVSQFIVEDNQMLITAGKNDLAKFYPYIRKPNKTSEEICFYAVSVTYFLAE